MKVFVALFESDKFLLAKKRGLNKWSGGESKPYSFSVGEEGQFVLPGGTQKPGETYKDTAYRVFKEVTGHDMPNVALWSNTFEKGAFVLVCFSVNFILFLEEQINGGLEPSPVSKDIPDNRNVRNWELSRVFARQKLFLDSYLGKTEVADASATGGVRHAETKCPSGKMFKEMIPLLKSVQDRHF